MKDYDRLTTRAELTDNNISATMITNVVDNMYLYVDRIVLSVYEAADGGGILQILDSDGGTIWKTNVDGIKDLVIPFGDKGTKIGMNQGAQAILVGASLQASVCLSLEYHTDAD